MRRAAAILILTCLPLGAAFGGNIYRSVDAQGHLRYSDTPSPGAVLISAADLPTDSTSSNSADDSSSAGANDTDSIHQRLVQQAAARAVQRDTEQAQAKQCKQAQDNYQKVIQARRLYTLDKSGTRQYLTDDQAEKQRVKERLAMQAACKSST